LLGGQAPPFSNGPAQADRPTVPVSNGPADPTPPPSPTHGP
jgi:hypothetical protein